MQLCHMAQQAALDAHRVGSSAEGGVSLISSLLNGEPWDRKTKSSVTLVVVKGVTVQECRRTISPRWCAYVDGGLAVLCPASDALRLGPDCIISSYNPQILAAYSGDKRREVCTAGVSSVMNYYGIAPEEDDLNDLILMFCHLPERSRMPITTREGVMHRDLGWMETLMACDYTKLPLVSGYSTRVSTATSAVAFSNFDSLV